MLMKYIICFIFTVCFLASTSFGQLYWWQMNQTGNSLGGPIEVANYNTNIVYYGSDSTIYVSIDRGETFSVAGNVPSALKISCIITHNALPGVFLVAIQSTPDQIYKTTDNGQTWILSLDFVSFS